MAQIVMVRQMPNLRYLLGVYLVDIFCLGLKDTFYRNNLKEEDVHHFVNRIPQELTERPYEDVRSIVLGAIEYAAQWKFEPNADWNQTKYLIEHDRSFERKFTFGKDGKLFYIEGPHENVIEIMVDVLPALKGFTACAVGDSLKRLSSLLASHARLGEYS